MYTGARCARSPRHAAFIAIPVAAHLEQRGGPRRAYYRKLTDDDVAEAAYDYLAGDSLAAIGSALNVTPGPCAAN